MKTTKQIKEELEKGCGERLGYCKIICSEKDGLCDDCDLKLQQHNETLKARNQEIKEIVENLFKIYDSIGKDFLLNKLGVENEKTTA